MFQNLARVLVQLIVLRFVYSLGERVYRMYARWRVASDVPRPAPPPRRRTNVDDQLLADIAKLSTVSQRLVQKSIEAATNDNEDHSFSGVMFAVECLHDMPIQFIEIQSVAVRGDLGLVSVYTCDYDPESGSRLTSIHSSKWTRRFGPTELEPNWQTTYTELPFQIPLRLAPGQLAGVYVHSELPGDTAIVYDDMRTYDDVTYRDSCLSIHPGTSHTSNIPFSNVNPIWGGNAWRANREFVGKIKYGAKYFLWTPLIHERFPGHYKTGAFTFLCAHHHLDKKRERHSLGSLSHDVIFRILNFCGHDWFDTSNGRQLGRRQINQDSERRAPHYAQFLAALSGNGISLAMSDLDDEEEDDDEWNAEDDVEVADEDDEDDDDDDDEDDD